MLQKSTRRYVLLDRDGTLNVEKNYLSDPAELELLPGVAKGLKLLQSHGFGLVVLSNQSGIGRGILTTSAVDAIHARLRELLHRKGVRLDGIYYCPHSPQQKCICRKPSPGMIYRASEDLKFDPQESFVVGDKASDIEMGQRVKAKTILVLTGYGKEAAPGAVKPDLVAEDFAEAAAMIIRGVKAKDRRRKGEVGRQRASGGNPVS